MLFIPQIPGLAPAVLASLPALAGGTAAPSFDLPVAEATPIATPSSFALVENAGQWDSPAVFAGSLGDVHVRLLPGAIQFQLVRPDLEKGVVVRLTLEGGDPECRPRGEQQRVESRSYLTGSDSEQWRSNVASFGSALYEDLAPGVDLRLREGDGRLEWDLLLDAGIASDGLVMRCEGVDDLGIDEAGDLVLETELGAIRMGLPTSWTVSSDGSTSPVESSYHRLDQERFGFAMSGRDSALPLVIDPGVEWATYIGGTGFEVVLRTKCAPNGNIYVCGITDSLDFPTTVGVYQQAAPGSEDGFVSVYDPTGATLLHSTYIGGAERDGVGGMDIAQDGGVVVAGYSFSADFPTTAGALQQTKGAGVDGFVARFDASLTTLEYSSFLGDAGSGGGDWTTDLEIDATGAWNVCGVTRSADFRVTPGAFQTTFAGGADVFVTRIVPGGNGASDLVWSSFLGGSMAETRAGSAAGTPEGTQSPDIGVGADGSVTIAGVTNSVDFPTTPGAFRETPILGGRDAFVARLSQDGSSLDYATLIGGTNIEISSGLALDGAGRAIVAGATFSGDFPVTPGALQQAHALPGTDDAWVIVLNADGTDLDYGTLLGKQQPDYALCVDADASGVITVGGATQSPGFPTTAGAAQPMSGGGLDAFLTRLDPSRVGPAQLISSTFFGGALGEDIWALDLIGSRSVAVGGATSSLDLPVTPGSPGASYAGGVLDAWVAVIDLEGLGISYCSPAVHNSTGQPGQLSAIGSAAVSANNVTLEVTGLPPMQFGMFVASQARGLVPMSGGSQGTLCLGGPIGRYQGAGQILSSGAAGQLSLALDLTQTPTPGGLVAVQPGETWNFQLWHRDVVGGIATSNFTDGLEIAFE